MIDYQYSYFVGSLIFVAAWVVFYFVTKTHRRQMIWGSVLSAPFALAGFLFIPEYWNPPSLFDLDARFGIGIEDVIWSAAVGGIASADWPACAVATMPLAMPRWFLSLLCSWRWSWFGRPDRFTA
jgi:hypothetical protein